MTGYDFSFDPRWDGASIPQRHWHFHRKLLERYGLLLLPGEFGQILREIRSGEALLVEHRSSRRAIYWVHLRRQFERIYVLSDGKDLITAWPATKKLKKLRTVG